MYDRISEIKSTLDKLSRLIEEELLEQRKEIESLKKLSKQDIGVREVVNNYEVEKKETELIEENIDDEKLEPQAHKLFDSKDDEDDFVFEVKESAGAFERDKKKFSSIFSFSRTILDEAIGNSQPAWMTDMPGDAVEKIENAFSINDRILFLRELFSGDEEQYDLTLSKLNEITTFSDAHKYLNIAFDDWDEESDTVYRFYMAVRRKIRN